MDKWFSFSCILLSICQTIFYVYSMFICVHVCVTKRIMYHSLVSAVSKSSEPSKVHVVYLPHVVSFKKLSFLFLLSCSSAKKCWPFLFALILSSRESAPISCHKCTVFSFACIHSSCRDTEREWVQDGIQRAGERVERGINHINGEKWHQIKKKNKEKSGNERAFKAKGQSGRTADSELW